MVIHTQLVFLIRAAVIITALGLLPGGCTGLFFYPSRDFVLTPDRLGLSYREVWFEAADGTRLNGWWLPAEGEAKGTVLHLHGNAENISTHVLQVGWLPEAGFNVFVFDYRGYGRSEGAPTIEGLADDARAALRMLLALPEAAGGPISVLGQSLGGSIAISAVSQTPERTRLCLLVTEGAFAGYRRIVREKLADFWLTWPLREPLSVRLADLPDPVDAVEGLAPLPLLIIHGEADAIVSLDHAFTLYGSAQEPKTLWIVPGVGHNQAFALEENRRRLVETLAGCTMNSRSQ
jgi:hypothetical protein